MTQPVSVSTEIAAPPDAVWPLVSDLTRMGEWSPEADGIEWRHGATGAVRGATFKGKNHHGSRSWSTIGTITTADAATRLAFTIKAVGLKVAEWRYDIEPTASGCRVTETWTDERGAVARMLGKLATGVDDRASHNRTTMAATLAGLKAAAESATTTG
ncbi:MAG TPA: SRPBCC family protein [Acidimicrobiales bacterium]|jgi:uncharacterized protein YndB with AHSA1/START domain